MESERGSIFLLELDLIAKPASTFADHALVRWTAETPIGVGCRAYTATGSFGLSADHIFSRL
jgi:hypothetical protein